MHFVMQAFYGKFNQKTNTLYVSKVFIIVFVELSLLCTDKDICEYHYELPNYEIQDKPC